MQYIPGLKLVQVDLFTFEIGELGGNWCKSVRSRSKYSSADIVHLSTYFRRGY